MTTFTTASKVITPIVHRENGRVEIEYRATFDDNCIGFFATQAQAENELNQHVLDLCERGLVDRPLALQAEQALLAANPPHADPSDGPPTIITEGDDIPTLPIMDGAAIDAAEIIRTNALWLLSRGIDACTVCGGAHRPTQCPDVAAALHAPELVEA